MTNQFTVVMGSWSVLAPHDDAVRQGGLRLGNNVTENVIHNQIRSSRDKDITKGSYCWVRYCGFNWVR